MRWLGPCLLNHRPGPLKMPGTPAYRGGVKKGAGYPRPTWEPRCAPWSGQGQGLSLVPASPQGCWACPASPTVRLWPPVSASPFERWSAPVSGSGLCLRHFRDRCGSGAGYQDCQDDQEGAQEEFLHLVVPSFTFPGRLPLYRCRSALRPRREVLRTSYRGGVGYRMLKGETSQQEEPETPKRPQCLRARITPASLQEDLQFKHGTVYSKLWPTVEDSNSNFGRHCSPRGSEIESRLSRLVQQ